MNILLKAGGKVWRFFNSIRLAVFLILTLTGLCLIGALLIQVPQDVASNSVAYAQWLDNVARTKVGILTHAFAFLRLFDVFHSPLFLLTGALLVTNIVVCSLNRWKGLRRSTSKGRIKRAEEFYLEGSNQAEFSDLPVPSQRVAGLISKMLKSRRYRVHTEGLEGDVYIAAEKNAYFRLGTYLNHLSIVLLIMGFLIGSQLSFRNPSFIVPEGSVREVGYGTNLSLRLQSFVDEYWADGTPKDYRSKVVIYEAGQEVKRGVIRVNHPLSYNGIRFHQSFFGPAVVMRVRTIEGEVLFHGCVALPRRIENRPFEHPLGSFTLPSQGLTVYVVGPALDTLDPLIGGGQVGVGLYRNHSTVPIAWAKLSRGEPCELEGLEFMFLLEGEYSGFQVSRDPGIFVIWIACGLFLLGLGMVFYLPYRQVWGLVEPRPQSRSRALLRSATIRSPLAASEFQDLIDELENQFAYNKEWSDNEER
jgi:cytochrome c biogenesis protein